MREGPQEWGGRGAAGLASLLCPCFPEWKAGMETQALDCAPWVSGPLRPPVSTRERLVGNPVRASEDRGTSVD